ncbi:hypothetical protein [Streptomyces noursei]
MTAGIPGVGHIRPFETVLRSLLRKLGASSLVAAGPDPVMEAAVVDGHPYWVVIDPEREDEWAWFDALSGSRLAGPIVPAGAPDQEDPQD